MIRVAIVDDSDMVRTGFGLIVDNETDMTVVGTADSGREGIDTCRSRRVDVVLMDIRMPGMDGISATKEILRLPDPPRVLILTTFGLDEYVVAAIEAGAAAFLLKDASSGDLVAAIRAVAMGDGALSPAVTRIVLDHARKGGVAVSRAEVPGLDELTDREVDVLTQLTMGRSNIEIAEALFLSEATVKTHVGRVLTKLGVRDRVQAVIAAFKAGIGDP